MYICMYIYIYIYVYIYVIFLYCYSGKLIHQTKLPVSDFSGKTFLIARNILS